MTKNQLDYQANVERERHNREEEGLTGKKIDNEYELGKTKNAIDYAVATVDAHKKGADEVINAVNAGSNVVKAIGSILNPLGAGIVS